MTDAQIEKLFNKYASLRGIWLPEFIPAVREAIDAELGSVMPLLEKFAEVCQLRRPEWATPDIEACRAAARVVAKWKERTGK